MDATAELQMSTLSGLVFHEPWWLHAASKGRYEEVVVENSR